MRSAGGSAPEWDGRFRRDFGPEAGLFVFGQGPGVVANPLRPPSSFRRWPTPRPYLNTRIAGSRHHDRAGTDPRRLFRGAARIFDMKDGQRRASTRRSNTTTRSTGSPPSPRTGAQKRRNQWTSVEKMNVKGVRPLWREEVKSKACMRPSIRTSTSRHMLARQLRHATGRNTKQFDVIDTDNLFGDMLSDEAKWLTAAWGCSPRRRWARSTRPAGAAPSRTRSTARRRTSPEEPGELYRGDSPLRDDAALVGFDIE